MEKEKKQNEKNRKIETNRLTIVRVFSFDLGSEILQMDFGLEISLKVMAIRMPGNKNGSKKSI